MAFRFRIPRKPYARISVPGFPNITSTDEAEILMGEVHGMPASAPEERLARALDKARISYFFRYVAGAPKGMPGWKELDFLVQTNGLVYLVEVDTAFTHRSKEQKDILHDSILLNDRMIQSLGQLWPEVLHADGDTELAKSASAEQFVRQRFG